MSKKIDFLYNVGVVKEQMVNAVVFMGEYISYVLKYLEDTKFFLPLEDVMIDNS